MLKNLRQGMHYLQQGFFLIGHPEIKIFVIAPCIISIASFGFLGWLTFSYVSEISEWINRFLPAWLGIVSWFIKAFAWLIFIFFAGYTFTTLTLLVASPFNSLLAEKTEKIITGGEISYRESRIEILTSLPRSLFREFSKMLYYITLVLLAIFFSLIPILNSAAPIIWFLISAWMMSIQFLDYPMDNHNHSMPVVRKFAASKISLSLGFGSVVTMLSSIPIVNLLVIPSAVIGATILWCENSSEFN